MLTFWVGASIDLPLGMHRNSVAHFEIYADNPDSLSAFYTTLFDWKIEPASGMDYRMVETVDVGHDGRPTSTGGINGGIAKRPAGYPVNGSVNYVMVDSIEKTTAKARSLGAKVTKEKMPVPGMGWFAMFMDPEGNHFAIWTPDKNAK